MNSSSYNGVKYVREGKHAFSVKEGILYVFPIDDGKIITEDRCEAVIPEWEQGLLDNINTEFGTEYINFTVVK